jgi:RNA recognition motif-containing protein
VDRNYKSAWDEEHEGSLVPVFVGNIPWSLSNEDLVGYFGDYQPVSCNLLTNMYGKSRGFAIITFRSEEDAEDAIAAMNGVEINGRIIEVMQAVYTKQML